jgi:hypothetical protein
MTEVELFRFVNRQLDHNLDVKQSFFVSIILWKMEPFFFIFCTFKAVVFIYNLFGGTLEDTLSFYLIYWHKQFLLTVLHNGSFRPSNIGETTHINIGFEALFVLYICFEGASKLIVQLCF